MIKALIGMNIEMSLPNFKNASHTEHVNVMDKGNIIKINILKSDKFKIRICLFLVNLIGNTLLFFSASKLFEHIGTMY